MMAKVDTSTNMFKFYVVLVNNLVNIPVRTTEQIKTIVSMRYRSCQDIVIDAISRPSLKEVSEVANRIELAELVGRGSVQTF